MSEALLIAENLSALHHRLINQFISYSEVDLRTQYHPDLSQLGWHLNHIAFIEQYWLREVVLEDDSRTRKLHHEYFPIFYFYCFFVLPLGHKQLTQI